MNRQYSLLEKENQILREQIGQLKYFMTGSLALKRKVDDIRTGDTIHCAKETLHDIASGLLQPAGICVDIGPGLRPQRMLKPDLMHILVEPYGLYADELAARYPGKLTINMDGLSFLSHMRDQSVDTIFLLDVIEHLKKEDGTKLLAEVRRVARNQAVIFTPLGFMPFHYTDMRDEWGDIEHGETQTHRSGWTPDELPGCTYVISEDYHQWTEKVHGAFYAIMPCGTAQMTATKQPRVVMLSEQAPDFAFRDDDIIIADISFSEVSWVISPEPKQNTLYVPLNLTAEHRAEPIEILRNTIINFRQMEEYIKTFENVEPVGLAAQEVLKKLKLAA